MNLQFLFFSIWSIFFFFVASFIRYLLLISINPLAFIFPLIDIYFHKCSSFFTFSLPLTSFSFFLFEFIIIFIFAQDLFILTYLISPITLQYHFHIYFHKFSHLFHILFPFNILLESIIFFIFSFRNFFFLRKVLLSSNFYPFLSISLFFFFKFFSINFL